MPLFRRVAKRGFSNNAFAVEVVVINVGTLAKQFPADSEVTPQMLVDRGLIASRFDELKVLGDGEVSYALRVAAHRFSATAEAKLLAAGGAVIRIER
jgi:large subunit ribosomal protein L15